MSGYLPPARAAVIFCCSASEGAPTCESTWMPLCVALKRFTRLSMTFSADWFCPCQSVIVTCLPVLPFSLPPPHAPSPTSAAAMAATAASPLIELMARLPSSDAVVGDGSGERFELMLGEHDRSR